MEEECVAEPVVAVDVVLIMVLLIYALSTTAGSLAISSSSATSAFVMKRVTVVTSTSIVIAKLLPPTGEVGVVVFINRTALMADEVMVSIRIVVVVIISKVHILQEFCRPVLLWTKFPLRSLLGMVTIRPPPVRNISGFRLNSSEVRSKKNEATFVLCGDKSFFIQDLILYFVPNYIF